MQTKISSLLFIFCIGFISPAQAQDVIKGFGFSPQGFPLDYSKLTDFYEEVGSMPNGGVMWNGGWRDDTMYGMDSGEIPDAAAQILSSGNLYGFTPVIVFGWRSGETLYLNVPSNSTNNWSNPEMRVLFKSMLADFAATFTPPYVFLGNENSHYYEQNPADYLNWLDFYNASYDTIKIHSPVTQIGPVFHYEHLAGTGTLTGMTESFWDAIDLHDFSRIDVVGLTLYPWMQHTEASSVPETYLDPLFNHIGSIPVAITETGWPADEPEGLDVPWIVSEAEQTDYLDRLTLILEDKAISLLNWTFLYPMQDPGGSPLDWKLFGSISIRGTVGNKRPVYDPWVAFNPTAVNQIKTKAPSTLLLTKNYPNPFNGSTRIQYTLTKSSPVTISIFNIFGQKIRTLVAETKAAGSYHITWNGTDQNGIRSPSGVYMLQIQTSDCISENKLILLQ
jgi:hypothetical protein